MHKCAADLDLDLDSFWRFAFDITIAITIIATRTTARWYEVLFYYILLLSFYLVPKFGFTCQPPRQCRIYV